MNRKSIRLIKRHDRQPRHRLRIQPDANPNRWSTAVRSWVVEFRQRDPQESPPAFDSLFKDPLPKPDSTE